MWNSNGKGHETPLGSGRALDEYLGGDALPLACGSVMALRSGVEFAFADRDHFVWFGRPALRRRSLHLEFDIPKSHFRWAAGVELQREDPAFHSFGVVKVDA
jgi:hypothetical protein